MKRGSIASMASIAAIALLGSAYLTFGVARVDWLAERVDATMVIPRSGGLIPRSKVLLSGVEVGRITAVAHTPDGVRVDFRLDGRYRVPVASPVRIESLSGLGEPFLAFAPHADDGPYLRDGAVIEATEVTVPLSIPEVARTATRLLDQLEPEALSSIVATFDRAFAGTEAIVPELSRSTDLLAATLLSRTDLIRRMLVALQTHADDMAWSGPALHAAAGPWADFGPQVAQIAAAIARVIRVGDFPADYLIETPDTIGLVPLLSALAQRLDTLGPELAPFAPLFRPLTDSATDALSQLDISSLIAQALATTDPGGALRLQLSVK